MKIEKALWIAALLFALFTFASKGGEVKQGWDSFDPCHDNPFNNAATAGLYPECYE